MYSYEKGWITYDEEINLVLLFIFIFLALMFLLATFYAYAEYMDAQRELENMLIKHNF